MSVDAQADFAVGMTQESDGSFKLKMVSGGIDDCPTDRPQESAKASLMPWSFVFAVSATGALAFLVSAAHELATDAAVLHDEVAELQSVRQHPDPVLAELRALHEVVAGAPISPDQLLQLLAPSETGVAAVAAAAVAAAAAEVGGDPDGEPGGWASYAALVLLLVALLVPAILVALYEYTIGAAKAESDPTFSWAEQIAYRMDFWLSNYPSSKTWALMIITCILIAVGALVYGPVHEDEGADQLHHALWSSWIFVVTQSASDQETLLGRLVALLIAIGGMLIFALMVGIVSDAIRCVPIGSALAAAATHTLVDMQPKARSPINHSHLKLCGNGLAGLHRLRVAVTGWRSSTRG